jgi:hypothetical protein
MQYFGYLRRNPNDPPDTDLGGLNFWLGKLNQFNCVYNASGNEERSPVRHSHHRTARRPSRKPTHPFRQRSLVDSQSAIRKIQTVQAAGKVAIE